MTSKTSNKQNTTINEEMTDEEQAMKIIEDLKKQGIETQHEYINVSNEQKEIPAEMPYTYDAILCCKDQETNDALVRDYKNLLKFDALSNPKKFCGNKILYQFQFKNLLKCRRDKKPLLSEIFADEDKKQKLWKDAVHRNRRDKAPYPSPTDVYECYRINQGAIVMFKSSTAKYIYKKYNATSVLDPTMGWGGRLLGAMSLGIDYYGIDTNLDLNEPYEDMIDTLDHLFNIQSNINLTWQNCLDVDYSKIKYDLVLTSPPYVNMENYQYMDLFKNDDEFYKEFLIPLLNKMFKYLHDEGHMCINISPKMYKHLIEKYGARVCDEQVDLRQQMGKNHATKSQDYIYVWSKKINNTPIKEQPELTRPPTTPIFQIIVE